MKLPKWDEYPKKIYVKDEVYEIRFVAKVPDKEKGLFGLCDPDKKIIWIRNDQTPKGLLRTVIHELLHAIEEEWHVELKHKRIDILEHALVDILTDNL